MTKNEEQTKENIKIKKLLNLIDLLDPRALTEIIIILGIILALYSFFNEDAVQLRTNLLQRNWEYALSPLFRLLFMLLKGLFCIAIVTGVLWKLVLNNFFYKSFKYILHRFIVVTSWVVIIAFAQILLYDNPSGIYMISSEVLSSIVIVGTVLLCAYFHIMAD